MTPHTASTRTLLATKLHVPRPRHDAVRRERLTDRLRASGAVLTLISAPAGFGKSTLLAALDRNEDGQVGSDEIPVPIRLAVTLGPQVHQLLQAPTGAVRTIAPRDAATAPPDWFLSMDKNKDRDLSRGEFLGTTEQFRQFDADGDGLLSAKEALKLSAGQ